jgi:hypothetical protein
MLRTRPHPEHGYRACLGLMSLVKRYGGERVTARAAVRWPSAAHFVSQRGCHSEERHR